jgi:hypothetical protein
MNMSAVEWCKDMEQGGLRTDASVRCDEYIQITSAFLATKTPSSLKHTC